MQQTEQILFSLKRSLLEYALKHRIDYLMKGFANDKFTFSQYNISPIRFELYNMFIKVKHRRLDLFEPIIQFLNEFYTNFENVLEERLYLRVLVSLKALFINYNLKNGDLKKTSKLIKEHFAKEGLFTELTTDKENRKMKSTLEIQILRLRSQWNELILSKTKRDSYFEKEFKTQYDDVFFNFLLKKVISICDIINEKLPLTQLEETMKGRAILPSHFCTTLFNTSNLDVEDEVDIRLELFLDNLRLHKIQLDSTIDDNIKPNYCTKYIKKIYKNLTEWQAQLNDSEIMVNHITPSQTEQKPKSLVEELLYMDSQLDEVNNKESKDLLESPPLLNNQNKEIRLQSQIPILSVQNLHMTNDFNKTTASNITDDLTKVTSLDADETKNAIASYSTISDSYDLFNHEIVVTGRNLRVNSQVKSGSDLLTDDEKD